MKSNGAPVPVFKTRQAEAAYLAAYDEALSLWHVPFTELYIPTRFGAAHVIACGAPESPPLVLFHGAHASSTMWYPNAADLSRAHRLYAVDFLLEPGKSALEKRPGPTADLAGWITDILDCLGLRRADFAGFSRGAWNAMTYAMSRPERVSRLVLLSPAQAFTPITHAGFLFASLMVSLFPSERRTRRVVRIASVNPARIEPLFMRQYAAALAGFNVLSGIQMPPALFTDDELARITCPTLLLIGDRDVINGAAGIERARRCLPRLQAEIILEAGHLVSLERADIVNTRIEKFLSGGDQ